MLRANLEKGDVPWQKGKRQKKQLAKGQKAKETICCWQMNVVVTSMCSSLAGASIKGGRERRSRSQKDINLDYDYKLQLKRKHTGRDTDTED